MSDCLGTDSADIPTAQPAAGPTPLGRSLTRRFGAPPSPWPGETERLRSGDLRMSDNPEGPPPEPRKSVNGTRWDPSPDPFGTDRASRDLAFRAAGRTRLAEGRVSLEAPRDGQIVSPFLGGRNTKNPPLLNIFSPVSRFLYSHISFSTYPLSFPQDKLGIRNGILFWTQEDRRRDLRGATLMRGAGRSAGFNRCSGGKLRKSTLRAAVDGL